MKCHFVIVTIIENLIIKVFLELLAQGANKKYAHIFSSRQQVNDKS